MAKAILTLDDVDGKMSLSLFLEGGFQVESDAHQCANLLIKHLDQLGAVEESSEVRTLTGEEAENIIAEAEKLQTVAQAAPEPTLNLIRA